SRTGRIDATLRALATEKGRPSARSARRVARLYGDSVPLFVSRVPSRSETYRTLIGDGDSTLRAASTPAGGVRAAARPRRAAHSSARAGPRARRARLRRRALYYHRGGNS